MPTLTSLPRTDESSPSYQLMQTLRCLFDVRDVIVTSGQLSDQCLTNQWLPVLTISYLPVFSTGTSTLFSCFDVDGFAKSQLLSPMAALFQ